MKSTEEKRMERIRAGVWSAYQSAAIQQCLVPDCCSKKRVIKAHSIQERRVLGIISEKNHVYMFQNKKEGLLLELIGIHKATRFTGFCKEHDNELFDSVDQGENREVSIGKMEDIARLSLRSVACEFWKKQNGQKFFEKIQHLAKNNNSAEISTFLNVEQDDAEKSLEYMKFVAEARLTGTRIAIQRIGRLFYSLLNQIETGKYHLSRICSFTIPGVPRLAVAAHFPPEYDLHGNQMVKRTTGRDLPEVTLNVLPTTNGTHVMFLWHRRFEFLFRPFFSEIESLPDSQKALILSQMLLVQCENMALSPLLVDGWQKDEKSVVLRLFKRTKEAAIPYNRDWSIDLFGLASC